MKRSTRRSITGLLAVIAGAAVLGQGLEGRLPRSSVDIAEMAGTAATMARHALALGLDRSPEMIIGVGIALCLPVLAAAASAARWIRRRSSRHGDRRGASESTLAASASTSPVSRAWLSVEGDPARGGLEIRGELMRIGRDGDNDLAIADDSLEAFHAVIRRTGEAEFMIVDVSGSDGVAVNGQRTTYQRLRHGDRIGLGRTGVIFQRAVKMPAPRQPDAAALLN